MVADDVMVAGSETPLAIRSEATGSSCKHAATIVAIMQTILTRNTGNK
jgi:hypothetical protein